MNVNDGLRQRLRLVGIFLVCGVLLGLAITRCAHAVTVPYRARFGNAATVTDASGNAWLGDPGVCAGSQAYYATAAISDPVAPELYRGEQWGRPAPLTCTIPLANGAYVVKLLFAELYFGPGCVMVGGVGSRVFDILLNGVKVQANLDIFAETGGCNRPLTKDFPVTITSGALVITMPATANYGKLDAIRILSASVTTTTTPGPTTTTNPGVTTTTRPPTTTTLPPSAGVEPCLLVSGSASITGSNLPPTSCPLSDADIQRIITALPPQQCKCPRPEPCP